ncbi:V-set domain-containing T-cell activation inhibitor 1-like [Phodopus roborovskii]|uniref:V-set domain-containing T-cell activation inhibitor 1-like n=1 Tax=Phodopus roborovskii TaxID=109678 RepID=UPI0021E3838D|nr:V-set domain-containing T-cell activation inhibitor 1-like [Phodopus roborovskii]
MTEQFFTQHLRQQVGNSSSRSHLPEDRYTTIPSKMCWLRLTCFWLIRETSWQTVSAEEVRAHPFTDVTLDCEFSFIESTEDLEFYWEREDIIEEYEVEDRDFYRFFKYYDFFQVYTKVVYQFYDKAEQLEDQNALYEGRVSVDQNEISEGVLSLLLRNVDFMDEAVYKCSAITPNGRGESKVKLIVEDSEMPQVKFDKIDDEDVVTCTSKGWYLTPNVTWLDRGERDISNHSTVEVLEEQMNGLFRVYSVLKYPVKLNEKYVCHITETNENNRPIRSIRRYPKKRFGEYEY